MAGKRVNAAQYKKRRGLNVVRLIRSIMRVRGNRTTVKPNNLINSLQNFVKSGTIYAVQIKKHTAK